MLVEKKDAPKPETQRPGEPEVVDLDAEDELPLGALETQAEFDEMLIWGHESMAEAGSDPYARGVGEWIRLSSRVCETPSSMQTLVLIHYFRYIHSMVRRHRKCIVRFQ